MMLDAAADADADTVAVTATWCGYSLSQCDGILHALNGNDTCHCHLT